jgi:hypothetical protein
MMTNTCYSFIDDKNVVHVASVHRYVPEKKTMEIVPGSGGLSAAPNELEGRVCERLGADHLAGHVRVSATSPLSPGLR